jgi:hypothetical protein
MWARLLLSIESKLRLNETVQQWMAEAEESGYHSWITVAEHVQVWTCVMLDIDPAIGIPLMRAPPLERSEMMQLSFYRRYNRASPCTIPIGAPLPKLALLRYAEDVKDAKKTVILDVDPWKERRRQGISSTKTIDLILTGSIT